MFMLFNQGLLKISRLVNIILWEGNNDYDCQSYRDLDFVLNQTQRFIEGLTCLGMIPGLWFYMFPILILYYLLIAFFMIFMSIYIMYKGDKMDQQNFVIAYNIETWEELFKMISFLTHDTVLLLSQLIWDYCKLKDTSSMLLSNHRHLFDPST